MSGCKNSFESNKATFTSEMMKKVESVCSNNSGILEIEIVNDSFGYFRCKKQGYLKINKDLSIENIKNIEKEKTLIDSEALNQCFINCNNSYKFSIKTNKKCFCD